MNYSLKELQNCQLNILKEFERVCDMNNLQFYLAYGSCLGAIRHSGFIPWDDDIDVCMPIDDFEKLLKCTKDFQPRYFLQTSQTDKEYGLAIARLRDSNTTLIEESESQRNINHGIFIDIYPLYNSSKNIIKRKRLFLNSMLFRLMLYNVAPKNHGKLMKMCSSILLKLPPFFKSIIKKHAYKVLKSSKNKSLVSTFYGNQSEIDYDYDLLFPTKKVKFEDQIMPVPAQAEHYLEFTYGDYMELPPEEKRTVHHNYKLVDFENSYKKYKGKLYCEKQVKK